jgi:hypothetical protein
MHFESLIIKILSTAIRTRIEPRCPKPASTFAFSVKLLR